MHLSPAALDAAIQLLEKPGKLLATSALPERKSNG
jgi:hypothetical protein